MGLSEQDFTKSIYESIKAVQTFIKHSAQMAIALKALKTAYRVVDDAAKLGDTIDKTSQKLGISAREYQRWAYILGHSGADVSVLQSAMRSMITQVDGNTEAFERLGISLQELKTLSQGQLFARAISGLQSVENAAERTQLSLKVFGRNAMELAPTLNMSAESTEALCKELDEINGVLSGRAVQYAANYEDAFSKMQTAAKGLSNTIATELMPLMTDFYNRSAGIMGKLSGFISNEPTESLEEARAKLEHLREMQSLLGNTGGPISNGYHFQREIDKYEWYIRELEGTADEYTEVVTETAEATEEAAIKAKAAMEDMVHSTAEIYERMRQSVDGYFGAFERAPQRQWMSLKTIKNNLDSQLQWHERYKKSMQEISEYAEQANVDFGLLEKTLAGMGKNGADPATAIAEALKRGDTKTVNELVETLTALESVKDDTAGWLTGYIGGFDEMRETAETDVDAVREALLSLNNLPPAHFQVLVDVVGGVNSGNTSPPGRAGGVPYVYEHNTVALLHEGERVLTKEENKRYTENTTNNQGITINQYIQSVPQSPIELENAARAYFERARWGF